MCFEDRIVRLIQRLSRERLFFLFAVLAEHIRQIRDREVSGTVSYIRNEGFGWIVTASDQAGTVVDRRFLTSKRAAIRCAEVLAEEFGYGIL